MSDDHLSEKFESLRVKLETSWSQTKRTDCSHQRLISFYKAWWERVLSQPAIQLKILEPRPRRPQTSKAHRNRHRHRHRHKGTHDTEGTHLMSLVLLLLLLPALLLLMTLLPTLLPALLSSRPTSTISTLRHLRSPISAESVAVSGTCCCGRPIVSASSTLCSSWWQIRKPSSRCTSSRYNRWQQSFCLPPQHLSKFTFFLAPRALDDPDGDPRSIPATVCKTKDIFVCLVSILVILRKAIAYLLCVSFWRLSGSGWCVNKQNAYKLNALNR